MRQKLLLIAIVTVSTLMNCAFAATREGMTVSDFNAKQVGESIFIQQSTGGSMTLPFWKSNIGDDEFTEALKDSIVSSHLFAKLDQQVGSGWKLVINIDDVDQPLFGVDFKVTTKVTYTLTRGSTTIKQTQIVESGTAGIGDAVMGVKRLRLANEKSAKANIRKFLETIAAVQIPPA